MKYNKLKIITILTRLFKCSQKKKIKPQNNNKKKREAVCMCTHVGRIMMWS